MLIGCSLEGPGNQRAMYARRLCHEQVRGVWKRAWRIRVTHSTHLDEVIATRMPENQAGVRVVRRHHLLVRWTHWLNVPILLGLILSGLSIYWASPVYKHPPDAVTGNSDPIADIGIWICAHAPGLHQYSSPPDWIYNHISLGPGMLAVALRLHWLCAYLFMLNGLVFVVGSAMGSKDGARLPGGPVLGLMIYCTLTRQCPRRDGSGSNRRSISVPGGIPTLTLCRSISRQPAIRRPCLRLT